LLWCLIARGYPLTESEVRIAGDVRACGLARLFLFSVNGLAEIAVFELRFSKNKEHYPTAHNWLRFCSFERPVLESPEDAGRAGGPNAYVFSTCPNVF
jgi:hypothetical protein